MNVSKNRGKSILTNAFAPPKTESFMIQNSTSVGTLRVTSKRAGGLQSRSNEIVVPVDRTNPLLGNRHILRNHKDRIERDKVIALYTKDLVEDFARKGSKYHACLRIAKHLKQGNNIALQCWCATPADKPFIPCHGHILEKEILAMLESL